MDRHVRWVRHTVILRVLARLLVEGSVVMVAVSGLLLARDMDSVTALPLAFSVAQLAVIGRVCMALFVNPLNFGFLEHFVGRQLDFEVTRLAAVSDVVDTRLVDSGLAPIATLRNRGDADGPALDIYQSSDTLITASVARVGGSPVCMSRLTDGRILVTHDALIAPHEDLVVNNRPKLGFGELVESHRAFSKSMTGLGIHPSVAGVEVVADQLRIEQEAFAQLGPFVASFLSVGRRANPHLLQVRLSSDRVRERTMRPRRRPASIRPTIVAGNEKEIEQRAA